MTEVGMKWCSLHQAMEPAEGFGKNGNRKDGLQCSCRVANRAYNKKYYKANRETIAISKQEYRKANREAMASRAKEYYEANKEAQIAASRAWNEANKEAVAANSANNRAAKAGVPGRVAAEELGALFARYDYTCPCCGKRRGDALDDGALVRITVDHVVPLSDPDSTNDISNIQPLCLACNLAKGKLHIDYRTEGAT